MRRWASPRNLSFLIGAALFAQVLWLNVFRIHDPDTWWHLKTGELIWSTGQIPRLDPFSYVLEGKPWVDFEWLAQLLFYVSFKLGGAASSVSLRVAISRRPCHKEVRRRSAVTLPQESRGSALNAGSSATWKS